MNSFRLTFPRGSQLCLYICLKCWHDGRATVYSYSNRKSSSAHTRAGLYRLVPYSIALFGVGWYSDGAWEDKDKRKRKRGRRTKRMNHLSVKDANGTNTHKHKRNFILTNSLACLICNLDTKYAAPPHRHVPRVTWYTAIDHGLKQRLVYSAINMSIRKGAKTTKNQPTTWLNFEIFIYFSPLKKQHWDNKIQENKSFKIGYKMEKTHEAILHFITL